MTALAEDRTIKTRGSLPLAFSRGVAASTKIYKGGMIAVDVTGYSLPAGASGALDVYAVSRHQIDNSSGSDGDLEVEGEAGVFEMANSSGSDEITIADLFHQCYAADDQTVARTSNEGARHVAGIIVGITSTGVLVFISPLAAGALGLSDRLCTAEVAAADVSGGGTDSALTVDLKTLLGAARRGTGVVLIHVAKTEYAGDQDLSATATFATATKGSILASGNGWCVAKCDAAGQFACTLANSADETAYITAGNVDGGVDALGNGVIVVGCVPDDATWAA